MLIYFVWAWLTLSAVMIVANIGKPRHTITPGTAAVSLVMILLLAIGAYLVR